MKLKGQCKVRVVAWHIQLYIEYLIASYNGSTEYNTLTL